jgi:hypothetical protein
MVTEMTVRNNDILSLAVWAALLATPRIMWQWPTTEYTFQIWPGPIHPSISLIEMENVK